MKAVNPSGQVHVTLVCMSSVSCSNMCVHSLSEEVGQLKRIKTNNIVSHVLEIVVGRLFSVIVTHLSHMETLEGACRTSC